MALLFVKRTNLKPVFNVFRLGVCRYCTHQDRDQPVKFSTSEAARWRAEFTRSGNIYSDTPDAQPYIISLSLSIFMYYFFFYREENDIDEKLYLLSNIYDKVDNLEEVQLNLVRQHKLDKGENVTEIDKRLSELIQLREKKEGKARTDQL